MSRYKHGDCVGEYDEESWMSIRGWVTLEEAKAAVSQELGNDAVVDEIEHVYMRFGFRYPDSERNNGFTECGKGRGAVKSTRAIFGYV